MSVSGDQTANGSGPRHASIIGLVDAEAATVESSERWAQSVSRSDSRTSAPVTQSASPTLLVAYRGNRQGYFQDASYIVMLDGQVENLHELAALIDDDEASRNTAEAALIAKLFSRQGEAIIARFTGSFALAIVTRDTGETLLARDRFGTKPLFYAATQNGWAWASEIKCLCPLLDHVVADPEGLRQAIHYRYMIGRTLIADVNQVLPACCVRLVAGRRSVETQYWKMDFRPSPANHGLEYWADRVDAALDASFARLRSQYRDIGILLSGGVDSSLLALKAAQSGFRTCVALTARLPGENPELEWAMAVARHLGIEHQIVEIDESYIRETFPWLVWRMEEPPRHYNSFVLSKLFEVAGTRLEVVLNGHTADALFGPQVSIGIDAFSRRQAQLRFIPRVLRMALAAQLPANGGMRVARLKRHLQLDVHEYATTRFRIDYGGLGERIFGRHFHPANPGRRSLERFYHVSDAPTERFQRFDLYTFNQSHMAAYDRLSAPFGISVKLPFLAPEMVDVALEVPSRLKADRDIAKPVLKTLAARYFPKDWIYRTKQGFPTQISCWLEGQLGQWRRLLSEERTATRGFLDLAALRAAKVGRDDEAIWSSMSLEMFCRQFIDGEGGPESSRMPIARS